MIAAPVGVGALNAPRLRPQAPPAASDESDVRGRVDQAEQIRRRAGRDTRGTWWTIHGHEHTPAMLIRQAYRLQGAPFAGSGGDSLIARRAGVGVLRPLRYRGQSGRKAPANQMSDDDQVPAGRPVQARGAHREPGAARSMRSSWRGATASWVRSFGNRRLIARRSPWHAAAPCPTRGGARRSRQGSARPRRPGRSAATCARRAAAVRHEDRTGQHDWRRRDLSQFANTLSPFVNRIVLDRTGLTGGFDVDLRVDARPSPGTGDSAAGRSDAGDRSGCPVDLHRASGTARAEIGVDERPGGCPRHRPRRAADRGLGLRLKTHGKHREQARTYVTNARVAAPSAGRERFAVCSLQISSTGVSGTASRRA